MKRILVPLMLILMATVNAVVSPSEMQTMHAEQGLELSIDVTAPVNLLGETYLPPAAETPAADAYLTDGQTFCDQWADITVFRLVAYRDKKFDPGSCFGMEGYNSNNKESSL